MLKYIDKFTKIKMENRKKIKMIMSTLIISSIAFTACSPDTSDLQGQFKAVSLAQTCDISPVLSQIAELEALLIDHVRDSETHATAVLSQIAELEAHQVDHAGDLEFHATAVLGQIAELESQL